NADHEMMKRHLSGADTGLDPVEGTLIFKGSETTREMTGAYVGYRVFPNGSADWEACDTDGNTIGTSKDGSFIMPEEGCIVLDEEVPSGKFRFVCFSLLQPNEVTLDTEGNKLNEYLIDAGKNKTTVTLTGASFSETGNNGSFVVSCRGSSYILSCLTNAEAAYAIKGDNLVIDLVLAGDMSNYLMLLYMDENADMGDKYMPSVGDRANYKLTLSIPLVVGSLNMFSTEIGLKVLSISDDWYTVELDGEIFEGKKPTATFPSGVPILITLNNIEIEPLKTEKVNGKSCSVYEILIPGMPSKLKIWIEKNTDVLIKANTTVEGFAVTISLLSYNVQNLK
ncbi:MAG: hypothetical protein J5674_05490, partial [Candidatus Methanomethylophilaceae archaeon]|nr:hypothetical protein [Candidatus Methanomethylophilaceae archaeon]